MIEQEQVLRTDLNNSETRYIFCVFSVSWQGVRTHPMHLVGLCLRHHGANRSTSRHSVSEASIITINYNNVVAFATSK